MKYKENKILIVKIVLFVAITICAMTCYYKLINNFEKYGTEPFKEKEYMYSRKV